MPRKETGREKIKQGINQNKSRNRKTDVTHLSAFLLLINIIVANVLTFSYQNVTKRSSTSIFSFFFSSLYFFLAAAARGEAVRGLGFYQVMDWNEV